MAEKKVIQIQVNTNSSETIKNINDVTQSVNNLGDSSQQLGQKTSVFNDIKNVLSKMVPAFRTAQTGAVGFGASLKGLLLNPVILTLTAIVGTAKLIYEGFENTAEGAKKLKASMIALNATTTNVKDGLLGMAQALGYDLLSVFQAVTGQFDAAKESFNAANEISDKAWKQITKTIDKNTVEQLYQIERRQQANDKFKKKLEISESEINKLLVKSREILTDENETIANKSKALDEVTKYETKYSNQKVYAARVDLELAKERVKYTEKGSVTEKEAKAKVREATIALNNAEMENDQTRIKLNRQRRLLHRQEIADGKEAVEQAKENAKAKEEAEKLRLERIKEINDSIIKAYDDYYTYIDSQQKDATEKSITEAMRKGDADVAILDKSLENKLISEEEYNAQLLIINKNVQDSIVKIEKDSADAKEKIRSDNAKKTVEDQDKNWLRLQELTLSENEFKKLQLQQAFDTEISQIKDNDELKKKLKENLETELQKIDKDSADKRKELEKDVLNAKVQIVQDSLTLISDITSLFGKRNEKEARRAFQIDKAAKLASATMAGVEGTIEAYKTAQKSPITAVLPAYPIIQAGLAAAFAATNIAKIASTQFNSGGGGAGGNLSPNAPSGASPGVNAPNLSFSMQGGGSSTAQLLNSVLGQPLKAYVVSSDITSAQMLDAKAIKTSVL